MGKKVLLYVAIILAMLSLAGCGNGDKNNDQDSPASDKRTAFSTSYGLQLSIPDTADEQNITIPGSVKPGYKIFINDVEQVTDANGNFTANLDLVPGKNTVNIKIISEDGKSIYTTARTIVYTPKEGETPPPTLNVNIPATSEKPYILLQGTTDPDCVVNANGKQVLSDGEGKFIVNVPLKEGENIVTVTSTNKKGMKSTRQQVVSYQSPEEDIYLNVSLPDAVTGYVSKNSITVNGFTNPDNILEVYVNYFNDDETVQSLVFSGTPSNGQFSVNVTLAEEENTIIVKATNKEGKSKTVERTVYYKVE